MLVHIHRQAWYCTFSYCIVWCVYRDNNQLSCSIVTCKITTYYDICFPPQAIERSGAVGQGGGWFSSVSSFIANSFYWWHLSIKSVNGCNVFVYLSMCFLLCSMLCVWSHVSSIVVVYVFIRYWLHNKSSMYGTTVSKLLILSLSDFL